MTAEGTMARNRTRAFGPLLGATLAIIQAGLFATPALAQSYSNPGPSTYDPSLRSAPGLATKAVRGGVQATSESRPLEGMMVQLRGLKSNITTTVYTDENGHFEFPKLLAGSYMLRIVRALEFKPYLKQAVQLDGT